MQNYNSKLKNFRKKYPKFVYENFSWKVSGGDLKISFNFKIEPNIHFEPKVVIKNIDNSEIKKIGEGTLNNLIFHLGLIELLSYWKTTCSPKIEVQAGALNSEQIKWWKDLIINGLGQFFYENKIDFRDPSEAMGRKERMFFEHPSEAMGRKERMFFEHPNFLKIISLENKTQNSVFIPLKNQVLVPIGGGKDSIVSLEILKRAKKNIRLFSLNPTQASKKIIKIAGYKPRTRINSVRGKNPIIVKREIDKKLLELNKKGFLNGHTPFSAYLAFLSILVATIFGQKYIAFSNERSSNEGNLKYLGKVINHQYSKSFDFEKKFRKYSKRYLVKNLEYFSFLRPLYEIQIAKLFSKQSKYFLAFLSCNKPSKFKIHRWCGKCPKCLFVFTILYPFLEEQKLIRIFGQNLFENKQLLSLEQQLIGKRGFKPFECVGTKKESLIAFYLSWKKCRRKGVPTDLPFLLKYFENKILPEHPRLQAESKKILNSWNKNNFLPKEFKKILREELKKQWA